MTNSIRLRFAPSPTGHLHVGGARSALFNWLYCRRYGGTFIIRIEDTDVQRNIEGAEDKLLGDLRWLGLNWDEGPDVGGPCGPYRQSDRRDSYDQALRQLLDSGNAYYALDTAEELDALRKQAVARKENFRYPRPERFPTPAEAEQARADGRPVVVRFKTPAEPVVIHDEILGDASFEAGQFDDFVIVKSNGWPTYHFAVVVDDFHMKISHVLRAQEHLMNTPRHVFLQRALGYPTPKYAHLPLVFNLDGTKMSKRDKHKAVRQGVQTRIKEGQWTQDDVARIAGCTTAAAENWLKNKADVELSMEQAAHLGAAAGVIIPEIEVHDFRASGYLPEALLNFIALIGWSPGDDREFLTKEEMIAAFGLERINKTAGRFDREKLLSMNLDYAAKADPERLLAAFKDWAKISGSALAALDDATAARVLDACRGFRTFPDIESKAGILFAPDQQVQYDPQAVQKVLAKGDGRGFTILEGLIPSFQTQQDWSAAALDALVNEYCQKQGVKLGDVAQPLRVAVAGRPVSPAIGVTLALLGREKTTNRIRRALQLRAAE